MSNLGPAAPIISIAQQARPKVTGQREWARAWEIRLSSDVTTTLPALWASPMTGVELSWRTTDSTRFGMSLLDSTEAESGSSPCCIISVCLASDMG
jgi:hypothetical protein